MPIFPLRTVLFPGGILPLRIFEPRYVDMIRWCMREQATFGVVLLRQGSEVNTLLTQLVMIENSLRSEPRRKLLTLIRPTTVF